MLITRYAVGIPFTVLQENPRWFVPVESWRPSGSWCSQPDGVAAWWCRHGEAMPWGDWRLRVRWGLGRTSWQVLPLKVFLSSYLMCFDLYCKDTKNIAHYRIVTYWNVPLCIMPKIIVVPLYCEKERRPPNPRRGRACAEWYHNH